MRLLLSLVLLLAMLTPVPSQADDAAVAANQLLAAPTAPASALRITEYILQGVDALVSGSIESTRNPAHFTEVDPLMRPFSHGGIPTFVAAFATEDIIVGALSRRFGPAAKNLEAAIQIGANVWGITFTVQNER